MLLTCVIPPPTHLMPTDAYHFVPEPTAISCTPVSRKITDVGWPDNFRGYYDLLGCGTCNNYCRWVGSGRKSGGNSNPANGNVRKDGKSKGGVFWSCMTAASDKESFDNEDKPWNNLLKCPGKDHVLWTTTTTTTTITTTTTYDYHGAGNCAASCTPAMYENDVCDPQCNNYACRYDYGVCANSMATKLQRARTLAVIGGTTDALFLFDNRSLSLSLPSVVATHAL